MGMPYQQTYMGRLVSENGRIKLIPEAMDMIAVARSLLLIRTNSTANY
jgi:hypothetical protein